MGAKGKLFVISAPSGAGKTTLVREVLNRYHTLAYSVSHTTRLPRAGEVHGKDYFFTDIETFTSMINASKMLEWAKVHDNYYGTSRGFVEEALAAGRSLILDIDVQGAQQIMAAGMDMTTIFIRPPSMQVLEERLRNRGTDADAVIQRRLENARDEMDQARLYDHVVVNDELNQAIEEILALFARELG